LELGCGGVCFRTKRKDRVIEYFVQGGTGHKAIKGLHQRGYTGVEA